MLWVRLYMSNAIKVQNQTYNHMNILIFNLLYPEYQLIPIDTRQDVVVPSCNDERFAIK